MNGFKAAIVLFMETVFKNDENIPKYCRFAMFNNIKIEEELSEIV